MTEEIQSIEAQIAEADAKKAALEEELEQRKAVAREAFLIRVRADIAALGMSADDLIEALGGKRKAGVTPIKSRKPRAARVLKADPTKVYLGGALPVWLKETMSEIGFDPDDKAMRRAFIAEHMQAA
jgi:hypothetical protein